jgi:hypothetical protein
MAKRKRRRKTMNEILDIKTMMITLSVSLKIS